MRQYEKDSPSSPLSNVETLMQNGALSLFANWESSVDLIVQQEMNSLSQADPEYRAEVLKQLQLQKKQARINWELDAQDHIQQKRIEFLEKQNAGPPPVMPLPNSRLQNQRDNWDKNLKKQVDQGINAHQQALTMLDSRQEAFRSNLVLQEIKYKQGLELVKTQEDTVRVQLADNIANMRTWLHQNPIFHDTQGNMLKSGKELEDLLGGMDTALMDNKPLSQLAGQMVHYLENSKAIAEQETARHKENSTGSGVWPAGFLYPDTGHKDVQMVLDYVDGKPDELRKKLLQGKSRVVINSADAQGFGTRCPYPIGAICQGTKNTKQKYSEHGVNAFTYTYEHFGCLNLLQCGAWSTTERHTSIQIHARYTWYDDNAIAAQKIWSDYGTELADSLDKWRDTILPELSKFESQKANYQKRFDEFQKTAFAAGAESENAYLKGRGEIIRARDQWLGQVQQEKRKGNNTWNQLINTEREETFAQLDYTLRESVHNARLPETPGIRQAAQASLKKALGKIPRIGANLAAMPELPDVELLERTFFQFNRSLNSGMNFAVASALGEQARAQREQTLDSMQTELEKLDGSVSQSMHYAEVMEAAQTRLGLSDDELDANGTALNAEMTKIYTERGYDKDKGFAVKRLKNGTIRITRMEPTGALKLIGDPTDPNGYEPEMELRTIDIPPPDSVKTVATGSLFQEWDMNALIDTHFKNSARYNEYATGMGDVANDILTNAGAGVSRTLTHYSNQVQDQVSRAAPWTALQRIAALNGWETPSKTFIRNKEPNARKARLANSK